MVGTVVVEGCSRAWDMALTSVGRRALAGVGGGTDRRRGEHPRAYGQVTGHGWLAR